MSLEMQISRQKTYFTQELRILKLYDFCFAHNAKQSNSGESNVLHSPQ